MVLKVNVAFTALPVIDTSYSPPNIIFILADDLGWGDLSCYGNPYINTPYINQLANEGILFTDYYSPSPLCAPARAGILTGRYNHRTGAVDVSSNRGIDRIDLSEKTMGDFFRHAGYRTALIGKWHNGLYNETYLPHHRGFDLFFGFPNGGQDYYQWNLMRNGSYVENTGEYLTDVLTDEAISFVQSSKSNPFFLFLAHHVPHEPLQAPDSLIQKYRELLDGVHSVETAIVYAMIESMDHAIGRLLQTLDDMDLRENTIIVFTSDNGAYFYDRDRPRYHGPFAGKKGNVMEQGIRVPAIISWPNTIKGKRLLRTPVHGCDWLPTLYSLTGKEAPKNAKKLDGLNIMPMLVGDSRKGDTMEEQLTNRALFFQKTRYTPVRYSDAAIRKGNWKLYWPGIPATMRKENQRDGLSYVKGITDPHWEMPLDPDIPSHDSVETNRPRLYDLVQDPMEKSDLSQQFPDIMSKMKSLYDDWFERIYTDWSHAWKRIRIDDKRYWEGKPIPDPDSIYKGLHQWDAIQRDSTKGSAQEVIMGYWSYPAYKQD